MFLLLHSHHLPSFSFAFTSVVGAAPNPRMLIANFRPYLLIKVLLKDCLIKDFMVLN
jgi:hypothetical protein